MPKQVTSELLAQLAQAAGEWGYKPDQPEFYAPASLRSEAELLAWRARYDAGAFPEIQAVIRHLQAQDGKR